jgi:hypothetical protein
VGTIGRDLHRGIGRRESPAIRRQIGERHIDLMPHAADKRDRRGGHGPHEHLLVEGPQVFQAAATPHERDHIDPWLDAGGRREGGSEFVGRAGTLHPRGHHDHLAGSPAGKQRLEEVGNGGAGGAGDHGDPLRECW